MLYFMEFHLGAVFISTASAFDRLARSRDSRLSREDTKGGFIVFVTPSLDATFRHLCNIIHIRGTGITIALRATN